MPKNILAFLVFILGLLGFFRLELIGQISLNELIILAAFPFVAIVGTSILRVMQVRTILLLLAIYLLAQVGSDIYRSTPSFDYLRGWAKIGITTIGFTMFSLAFAKYGRAAVPFLFGAILAPAISYLYYGTEVGEENVYKFYIGAVVSMASFLAYGYAPSAIRQFRSIFPIGAAIFAFLQDARSLGGITLLALLISYATQSGSFSFKKVSAGAKAAMLLSGLTGALVILLAYEYAATSGFLGERARQKIEMQTSKDSGEFTLFSGRSEIYFAVPKIMQSPIVGHGSWAKDLEYVFGRAVELGNDPAKLLQTAGYAEGGLIPAHSHILGSWLEAGILGPLVWILALYKIYKIFSGKLLRPLGALCPVIVFALVGFCWDLAFSPYAANRRLTDGFMLALIAWIGVLSDAHSKPFKKAPRNLAGEEIRRKLPA